MPTKTGSVLRQPETRTRSAVGAPLLLLAALWSGPAAACNADAVVDFMTEMRGIFWEPPVIEEFTSTEGPGSREIRISGPDARREDVQFCVSYYCLDTVELRTPALHGQLFFFSWGGSSFPDANESSVVYSDRQTGETCLIRHRGDTLYKDSAVGHAEDLMRHQQDAQP